ncbi:unnamed protein product [Peronospora belbahrii]|uniref:holo-[acyl-carrier-protein] synthase n=1 Tax=Peronospora belbahrii TaxID=622444 RepID=A0AAU9L880_9STRA|nr:unnamed protein product [Peronospora belbahrii]CAH0513550.1 unnamed protein product [Peronospora belbahrii]
MSLSYHCLRFVNVSEWNPISPEWQRLVSQLPANEKNQVMRYMFTKDQNLALASRLLQRQLIHELFHVQYDAIEIKRTPENKPYWRRPNALLASPQWNYNVSHHGTIVAIVSNSRTLVGVDVVRLTDRPHDKTSAAEFFRAFAGHFNPSEWDYIRGVASVEDEDSQYTRFYQLWSLKEAYIKAVGVGMGFALLRAEFVRGNAARWELILDGQRARHWHFTCTQLDSMHLVSVAYGPYSAMWMPKTSSLFSEGEPYSIVHAADIEESEALEGWQQWRLQDLLQSS